MSQSKKNSNYSVALLVPVLLSYIFVSELISIKQIDQNESSKLKIIIPQEKIQIPYNPIVQDEDFSLSDKEYIWINYADDSINYWKEMMKIKPKVYEEVKDYEKWVSNNKKLLEQYKVHNKKIDTSKIYLLTKYDGLIKFSRFPIIYDSTTDKERNYDFYFKDLNNDGILELITIHWAFGAHCCYSMDIFRKLNDTIYAAIFNNHWNQLQFVFDDNNIIKTSIEEYFAYYTGCYACNLYDILPYIDVAGLLHLKFDGKSVVYANNVDSIDYKVEENLTMLKKFSDYFKEYLEVVQMDEIGLLKTYLQNIITYYYNNGLDKSKTRKMFYKYYPLSDKKYVFNDFMKTIKEKGILEFYVDLPIKKGIKK